MGKQEKEKRKKKSKTTKDKTDKHQEQQESTKKRPKKKHQTEVESDTESDGSIYSSKSLQPHVVLNRLLSNDDTNTDTETSSSTESEPAEEQQLETTVTAIDIEPEQEKEKTNKQTRKPETTEEQHKVNNIEETQTAPTEPILRTSTHYNTAIEARDAILKEIRSQHIGLKETNRRRIEQHLQTISKQLLEIQLHATEAIAKAELASTALDRALQAPTDQHTTAPNTNRPRRTYANAVKDACSTLIIQPQSETTDTDTTTIQNHLQSLTSATDISIQNIKRTRRGGLLIKFQDQTEAAKARTQLQETGNSTYNIITPNVKKTRIILFHVPEQATEAQVKKAILLKLDSPPTYTTDTIAEVTATRTPTQGHGNTRHWILDIHSHLATPLTNNKYIYIGFKACPIKKYITVTRCYHCQRFNHIARECRGRQRCPDCGGNHPQTECKVTTLLCVNCHEHNTIQTEHQHNTDHSAASPTCPLYQQTLRTRRTAEDDTRTALRQDGTQSTSTRPAHYLTRTHTQEGAPETHLDHNQKTLYLQKTSHLAQRQNHNQQQTNRRTLLPEPY